MSNKNELRDKIMNMTPKEFEEYLKSSAHDRAISIKQFIKYLEDNFDKDDKLCYIDCIEGLKYDATPIEVEDLGKKLFKYVKTDKAEIRKNDKSMTKKVVDAYYPYVTDDSVIVL